MNTATEALGLLRPSIEALAEAQSLALGHDNQYIEPQHLLRALLAQGLNANQAAREMGISKSKAYRMREVLGVAGP